MTTSPIVTPILDWYADAARDLPWRRTDASAWSVMVDEFTVAPRFVSGALYRPVHLL